MLTEAEVERSMRRLFGKGCEFDAETFDQADSLLDELRLESPLRHRLQGEIDELRELHDVERS